MEYFIYVDIMIRNEEERNEMRKEEDLWLLKLESK